MRKRLVAQSLLLSLTEYKMLFVLYIVPICVKKCFRAGLLCDWQLLLLHWPSVSHSDPPAIVRFQKVNMTKVKMLSSRARWIRPSFMYSLWVTASLQQDRCMCKNCLQRETFLICCCLFPSLDWWLCESGEAYVLAAAQAECLPGDWWTVIRAIPHT